MSVQQKLISNNILLFPTLITISKRKVDELEKESWFSAYLEMSNEDGKSMDFLGYQSIHHDKRFIKVFSDIATTVRKYLDAMNIKKDIDINITKSWFNIKTVSGNPIHNHAENHISFTYYPHVHENYKDKRLTFFNEKQSANEPYNGFFENLSTDWNDVNCRSYNFPVEQGNIFIFPSSMDHGVGLSDDDSNIESFNTIEELKHSRFCVAGDIILTRKDVKDYNRLLTPIENWRKF